jgi:hypothetical protein
MNMEIVSIEKKTFEMMVAAFGALSEKVAALRRKSDTGRMERWLTGEEVCGQLRISPRTLQTLRDRKVCRNTRCAFFFFIDYKNRLIFLSCDILRISLIYAFSTSK